MPQLYFLASIFIAYFSCFILKEAIGLRRIGPIILALVGTTIVIWPLNNTVSEFNFTIYILPKLAAFCYSMAQIFTRKLGANTKAFIMAFYLHLTFLIMSLLFYSITEEGKCENLSSNPSFGISFEASVLVINYRSAPIDFSWSFGRWCRILRCKGLCFSRSILCSSI